MRVRDLVDRFYSDLWNERRLHLAAEILAPDVAFRGSLGNAVIGADKFCEYVQMVTTALAGYHCETLGLIAEADTAAARMRFSGTHVGTFLGRAATGKTVSWAGAAFFRAENDRIAEIWVLGDLVSLHAQLDGREI